jgi:23S rRNA pseudouridine1911/1915/1917 synthase
VDRKVIPPGSNFSFEILEESVANRLDMFLSEQFVGYSRSYFQKLISSEGVLVNDSVIKPSYKLKAGDKIKVTFPDESKVEIKEIQDDMGVEVIFEHSDFLIVYKPAGLLVHATDTAKDEITLVDWLLNKFADLKSVGASERPGIIHRLDQDTSGLLVIARNNYAHTTISQMFKDRKMQKTYWAVVKGHPEKEGTIELAIMRHPVYRNKMTHVQTKGKLSTKQANARDAVSHYKVLEDFDNSSLVEVKPVTGRTHQIRVHFSGIGHPLLADKLYGQQHKDMPRQALHAKGIEFEYEGEKFKFEKEPPKDFMRLLEKLK